MKKTIKKTKSANDKQTKSRRETIASRVEQSQTNSELRYRRLFETAQDGILILDAKTGAITDVNPYLIDMLGYSRQEFIEKKIWQVGAFKDIEASKDAFEALQRNEYVRYENLPLKAKGGRLIQVEFVSNIYLVGDEKVIQCNIRDITARTRVEDELREHEQRLTSIYNAVGDSVFQLTVEKDGRYRFTSVNRAFLATTGLTSAQVVGKRVDEVIPKPSLSMVMEKYAAAIREKEIVHWEETSDYPIGRRTGEASIAPVFDEANHCTHLVGAVHDITERKRAEEALRESEERFRTLVENSTMGLYRTTPDGRIDLANPALIRMLGYSSFDDLSTRNLEKKGFEPLYPRTQFVENIEKDGGVKGLESAWKRKDGTTIYVRESARAIRGSHGKTLYYEGTVEDVTARNRAEEALRESETSYRTLIESASDGIFITDAQGRYVDVNALGCRMLGYTREELLALRIPDIIPAGEVPRVTSEVSRLNTSEVVRSEWQFRRKDGTLFAGEISGTILPDGRLLGILRDITERKLAEGKLLSLHQQNELILRTVTEGIMGLDLQGNHTFVNPAAARMLGYEVGELLYHPSHSTLHHSKSDGSPYPKEECKIYAAYRDGVMHHVSDEVFWRKDGTSFPVEYVSMPSYEQGRLVGAVVTFLDITERKLAEAKIKISEAKYGSIVENSSDQIFMIDRDNKIVTLNTTAASLFLKSPGEIVGKSLFEVFPEADAAQFSKPIKTVFDTGKCLQREEKSIFQSREIYNSILLNPVKDDNGRVIAVTGIVRDITELKQAEEIKSARAIAEAANRAKSDFLSNMSHELRTPLNSIIGFSEVLFDQTFGPLNETQKDYLNDVITSGQHLLSLINDILDLSKVEAGKMELTLTTFSLNRLLKESFMLIKEKTLKHNIKFTSEIPDEIGEVLADERKIKQIVYNLLSNAVKFTPDGGKIGLRARKIDEHMEVSVWDTGIGLSTEDQSKLFEKFIQIRSSYTGKIEGTGLGLSLVKSMVELHGGNVRVESEGKDKGSTFTFTLPIKQRVNEEERT